jgi:predicted peroxiredoxin
MESRRKLLGLVVLLSVGMASVWLAGSEVSANQTAKKPVFVLNLTSGKEDLHAAWMGLQLAEHALNDGRDVILFLNVHAAELASNKIAADLAFRDKPPMHKHLGYLTSRGAKLLVCPACLEALGIKTNELIEEAQLASRESLFGPLGPDAHVFSY